MLVDQADYWLRQNNKADGGWNRQQHHEPHGMSERAAKLRFVPERGTARNEGESDGCDCDTENSEGQLHETKRNVEPTDGTIAQSCREPAVDQNVHLDCARCDDGRA